MKIRFLITFSLLAVLVAACAPAVSPQPPATQAPLVIAPTATLPLPIPTLDRSSQPTAGATQELAPTPFPIATSRGPNLEASDPSTVSMANGGLQFVEFFEFW